MYKLCLIHRSFNFQYFALVQFSCDVFRVWTACVHVPLSLVPDELEYTVFRDNRWPFKIALSCIFMEQPCRAICRSGRKSRSRHRKWPGPGRRVHPGGDACARPVPCRDYRRPDIGTTEPRPPPACPASATVFRTTHVIISELQYVTAR